MSFKKSFVDTAAEIVIKEGKEIAFVVAGKEDVEKVSFFAPGWGSINGISKHIDRFINLDNVKLQAKAIQKAMQK